MQESKTAGLGDKFVNFTKELGNKIVDGAVFVGKQTKKGAVFVGTKTRDGIKTAFTSTKTKITGEKSPEEELNDEKMISGGLGFDNDNEQ